MKKFLMTIFTTLISILGEQTVREALLRLAKQLAKQTPNQVDDGFVKAFTEVVQGLDSKGATNE